MLVDKVNRLLEVAQETKPQQVKQPDTIRATTLVSAMKQIDDAVADVEKAAAATKKLLEKELQQHKKLMEKLFNVLEKPTTTTTKAAAKLGYKDWQIKWWLLWKDQQWEELTWEVVPNWRFKELTVACSEIKTRIVIGNPTFSFYITVLSPPVLFVMPFTPLRDFHFLILCRKGFG